MNREQQIRKLFEIMRDIYTQRHDSHPTVAAQFHVDLFISKHKHDKYFDDLLQMEIEDCSRAIAN